MPTCKTCGLRGSNETKPITTHLESLADAEKSTRQVIEDAKTKPELYPVGTVDRARRLTEELAAFQVELGQFMLETKRREHFAHPDAA